MPTLAIARRRLMPNRGFTRAQQQAYEALRVLIVELLHLYPTPQRAIARAAQAKQPFVSVVLKGRVRARAVLERVAGALMLKISETDQRRVDSALRALQTLFPGDPDKENPRRDDPR